MKSGVLLLAHGAPERVEDVPEYLSHVRGGQPVSAHVLEEVRSRYTAIGGSSPLTHWTRVQAEALQQILGMPVFFGMRNWHPFVKETMQQVRAAGIERLACLCLAPQFSEMSIGLYMRHTQTAAESSMRFGVFQMHSQSIEACQETYGPLARFRWPCRPFGSRWPG